MFLGPTLTIDLSAIVANWQTLRAQFKGDETAAVVKADAYGLGMVEVATALEKEGCNTFFVATLQEAIDLRAALADVRILVFHGVQKGEEFAFATHKLIPVLNSREQIDRWKPIAAEHIHAVSALHVDTAMGRLGLQPDDFLSLIEKNPKTLEECRVGLVMSHLACAPDVANPLNAAQLTTFKNIATKTPGIPLSLCNSGGIYLDKSFHFNLARPGCSLYGIEPNPQTKMNQVATWTAPILMTRTLTHEQSVGYGATMIAPKGTRIATVACGYADGYPRHLSNRSVAYVGDHRVKLLGRVTMDMLSFDVTEVPDTLTREGMEITLLGDKDGIRLDEFAHIAETIGYEIITRIGPRVTRKYSH